jgi:hypothetical protein
VITVEGLQETETYVTADEGACTVKDAVPEWVVSSALVAVTVTPPAIDGAVKRPVGLMVPVLADQLTAELYVPVPSTSAAHRDVAPAATVEGLHDAETELTELLEAAGRDTTPAVVPQATGKSEAKIAARR